MQTYTQTGHWCCLLLLCPQGCLLSIPAQNGHWSDFRLLAVCVLGQLFEFAALGLDWAWSGAEGLSVHWLGSIGNPAAVLLLSIRPSCLSQGVCSPEGVTWEGLLRACIDLGEQLQ
jgi:hypothetical protein